MERLAPRHNIGNDITLGLRIRNRPCSCATTTYDLAPGTYHANGTWTYYGWSRWMLRPRRKLPSELVELRPRDRWCGYLGGRLDTLVGGALPWTIDVRRFRVVRSWWRLPRRDLKAMGLQPRCRFQYLLTRILHIWVTGGLLQRATEMRRRDLSVRRLRRVDA